MSPTKKCRKCLCEKTISDFWKCAGNKSGLQSYCKHCVLSEKREYVASHPGFDAKHNKLRYTRHRDKISKNNREWKKKNKEKVSETGRRYYIRNKNRIFDYQKENKENINRKRREWSKKNPFLKAYSDLIRRESVLKATPKWAEKEKIKSVYKECRRKTIETGVIHHVDHIIPLVHPLVCGLHVYGNLQILTRVENSRKGNKFNLDDV